MTIRELNIKFKDFNKDAKLTKNLESLLKSCYRAGYEQRDNEIEKQKPLSVYALTYQYIDKAGPYHQHEKQYVAFSNDMEGLKTLYSECNDNNSLIINDKELEEKMVNLERCYFAIEQVYGQE